MGLAIPALQAGHSSNKRPSPVGWAVESGTVGAKKWPNPRHRQDADATFARFQSGALAAAQREGDDAEAEQQPCGRLRDGAELDGGNHGHSAS